MAVVGYFPATLAVDSNTGTRLRNAEAQVYAMTDTSFSSPLAITDVAGVPLTGNKLVSNSDGIYPEFKPPAGVTQVIVKSGQALTPMTSIAVFAQAAEDAASTAQGAAGTASTAAGAATGAAADASASAAQAVAVGNSNDTIIESRIKDPASKTAKALGVLESTGAADAAPAINAALASISGTGRTLVLRGEFTIASTVIVPTGCRLDTAQAVVRSATGFTGNMLRLNTAALRTVSASIAAGSLIVTAAAGSFATADIGRSIIVPEAGPDVINAELGTGLKKQNLTGIITAVASDGSTATLNRAATQAASGKAATVHNRVADVTLDLGVWDRGDNAGSGTNLHSIFLRRGDRVRLRSLKYRARFQSGTLVGGKYGVSYGDMVDFDAGELGLDFRSNSDGIHGIGPLIRPRIRNVTGDTHDDLVAIGISDYADYADIAGPIVDPVVENVAATAEARAVLITANIRSEYQITGGVIRTVRGTTQSPLVRVTGANDIAGNISGHTGVPSIRLDDIQGTPRTVSPLVSLNARIGSVLITGANLKQTSGNGGVMQINEYSTVDAVTIQGLAVADGHSGNLIEVPSTSALRSLTISDTSLVKSGTGCLVYGGGVIERVTLRNFRQQGGRGMDIRRDSAVCQVMLENVETDVPILRPSGGSTQLTVFTAGRVLYTGTTEGLVRLAGGTPGCFVHAGEGLISASGRIVSRAATDKPIRGSGLTFRQPVSELAPQPGDIVFNTVAAAVAIGLAYFDGTDSTWKMLGATGSAGAITPPTAPGEPVNGVVGSDSFTTARVELSGSAPDGVGGPWAGATNTWVVQDGRAKSLGPAPGTSPTTLECRAKGDWRVTWTWRVATSGEAASRTERYFAMMIDGNNGIRLQRTGQTAASLTVAVVTGGTARTIITFAAGTIPSNTAAADYAAVMEVVKNTSTGEGAVSVTVNGVTATGTATAAEMTALEAATRFGMGTTSPLTEIDNLSVSVNGTRVA